MHTAMWHREKDAGTTGRWDGLYLKDNSAQSRCIVQTATHTRTNTHAYKNDTNNKSPPI